MRQSRFVANAAMVRWLAERLEDEQEFDSGRRRVPLGWRWVTALGRQYNEDRSG